MTVAAAPLVASHTFNPGFIPALQEKVDKANRKSARNGLGEPFTLTVVRRFTTTTTSATGLEVKTPWAEVEVRGVTPALPGWEFAAVVDWNTAVTPILHTSPDFTGVVTAPTDKVCEHCKKIRSRNETFLVRDPDGAVRQVGRQCLTIYTGIPVGWVSTSTDLREGVRDWSFGGRFARTYDVASLLLLATTVVSNFGYVKADGLGVPTRERVTVVYKEITGGRLSRWEQEIFDETEAKIAGSRDVTGEAAEILTWAATLPVGRSSYLDNLRALLASETIEERGVGYVVSAVTAFRREKDRLAKKAREAATKAPVPTGRVTVEGTVRTIRVQDGQWGTQVKVRVVSDDGWAVWGSLPRAISRAVVGDRVRFDATVEASKDDPTFGFASRPSKAVLLPAAA